VAVDRLIGLKFPAYLIPHPRKVIWLLHQHRQAYDLWQHPLNDLHRYPNGDDVRAAIHRADCELIPQARHVFANSRNVAGRLERFCGVQATPLYHPPRDAALFYTRPAEDFLYFPSRINPLKRQDLVLEALAQTRLPVKVYFSGSAEEAGFRAEMRGADAQKRLCGPGAMVGPVSEEKKRDLYARSLGVLFPAHR
jgi:glycosyltransferase involved in cell wall biosynthesis